MAETGFLLHTQCCEVGLGEGVGQWDAASLELELLHLGHTEVHQRSCDPEPVQHVC